MPPATSSVTNENGKRAEPAGLPFEKDIQVLESKLVELESMQTETGVDMTAEIEGLRKKVAEKRVEVFRDISPWDQVTVARHPDRPVTGDYVEFSFDEFFENLDPDAFGQLFDELPLDELFTELDPGTFEDFFEDLDPSDFEGFFEDLPFEFDEVGGA